MTARPELGRCHGAPARRLGPGRGACDPLCDTPWGREKLRCLPSRIRISQGYTGYITNDIYIYIFIYIFFLFTYLLIYLFGCDPVGNQTRLARKCSLIIVRYFRIETSIYFNLYVIYVCTQRNATQCNATQRNGMLCNVMYALGVCVYIYIC